ncbi:uncharacterized protein LOC122382047 isoform X2 [Amphibalanus amphitrite]|uniref:uncharacterized protein LOC122382047 isoform X2 n=1 Tax=Amphibalanus amphitrite TaxID=1232801 RepID=UPI001C924D54|nr:uncharacterized protein LOC122382047 isoform X2 [Amphibalanus amphitrite]
MIPLALSLSALLVALCGADKLPLEARGTVLADGYLPPPREYLPPPREYLPPPGRTGELSLPSGGPEGLSPPSGGAQGLSPPSGGPQGLSPPSGGPEGLSPPSGGAQGLSPPSTGELGLSLPSTGELGLSLPSVGATGPDAGLGEVIISSSAGSLLSLGERGPPPKATGPDTDLAVVLEPGSAHPGFCPRRQLIRSCRLVKAAPKECFADVDCSPQEKCCALDCGLQCVNAVQPSSCDKIVCARPGEECVDLETGPTCIGHSKSGQCPFHGQFCSNRILVCREDTDCEGDKLCCNLGCHRLCVDPASKEQHLGFCPGAVARPPTRCGFQCQVDDDCSPELKCCDNACGKVCQPGVVPFITCANRNCPSNTRCEMIGLEAVCKAL